MKRKPETLKDALSYIETSLKDESISLVPIIDAPLWLRLLSRGNYCAYKNIIYVPSFHFSLVSAPQEEDRTIATAKLLPWFMSIKDKETSNILKLLRRLFSIDYQLFYFLYEYFYLRALNHKFFNEICIGFMVSRRTWYFKKLTFEEVRVKLESLL